MRVTERKTENGKGNGHLTPCPHCGAGADGATIGLFWDSIDHCWWCVTCGYRGYEHAARPRTEAETFTERLWDDIRDATNGENGKLWL